MKVSAKELSKYILKNSSKRLSNLELQKTLYFTELDYIKEFKEHLIKDDFEAWKYGPVATEVYWEYRSYGANSIDKPEEEEVSKTLDKEKLDLIDQSIKKCNEIPYWELVSKSHKKGGAWDRSYKEEKKEIINKEFIKEEALDNG